MSLPDQVTSNDFLQGLPLASRQRLTPLGRQIHFPPGARIFGEGNATDDIFLIESGHVRLEMAVPQGRRVQLISLGPGDLIGWSPLFGNQPMTATAMALEPVQALAFNGAALRHACQADHELGFHVMKQLAQTLAQRLLATRLQLLDLYRETAWKESEPNLALSDLDPLC